MNKIHSLFNSSYAPTKVVVAGAILMGVLQVPLKPATHTPVLPLQTAHVAASEVEDGSNIAMANMFFGRVSSTEETQAAIDSKVEFVSTRKAYPASLAVIQKHENTIRAKARKYNVPEDVAIGIGLLENGGSETAKSPAGALGVFQLMPGTARNLGLTVNGKVDDRLDPEKNIDAGMRYLAKNYSRFGDWGLTTWSYHAGEGNVVKALKLYAKANHGITLPGIENFAAHKEYVKKYDITIHKLLSDPAVQTLTKKLNDDTAGYPFKVVATAKLFKKAKSEKNQFAKEHPFITR